MLLDRQLMLGSDLLVCPVLTPGDTVPCYIPREPQGWCALADACARLRKRVQPYSAASPVLTSGASSVVGLFSPFALETTGGHGASTASVYLLFTKQLRDSSLPADVLVGKLKKDISFALRRGTIAQVTTHALDGYVCHDRHPRLTHRRNVPRTRRHRSRSFAFATMLCATRRMTVALP